MKCIDVDIIGTQEIGTGMEGVDITAEDMEDGMEVIVKPLDRDWETIGII